MKNLNQITLEEILWAFGENKTSPLSVGKIKDYAHAERGNSYGHYLSRYSFDQTIQRIIENYCPSCSGHKGPAVFQSIGRGNYCLHKDFRNHLEFGGSLKKWLNQ